MLEFYTQYRKKVNVLVDILNNTLIGLFFIEGNLNAEIYEGMLRNQIVFAIRLLLMKTLRLAFNRTILRYTMKEMFVII